MKTVLRRTFLLSVIVLACGCWRSDTRSRYDKTTDKFQGRLVKNGQPITLNMNQKPILRVIYHDKSERFGVPLKEDGTFEVGWMPVGKYSANLERTKETMSVPDVYGLPSFELHEGQTEVTLEVGEKFGPLKEK